MVLKKLGAGGSDDSDDSVRGTRGTRQTFAGTFATRSPRGLVLKKVRRVGNSSALGSHVDVDLLMLLPNSGSKSWLSAGVACTIKISAPKIFCPPPAL